MQQLQETQVQSLVKKIPWRMKWQTSPVFLPGEFHGQWSLAGYSSWGREESTTAEQLSSRACVQSNWSRGLHGRGVAGAVVDVGKSGAEAFVGTPAVCAALVRHFHELFPSLHTLGGGDGETEAGSISSTYLLTVEL